MKKIRISSGQYALVDDADHADLMRWRWSASRKASGVYAVRGTNSGNSFQMHRQIMSAPAGRVVDHINHNTLDNRRANLRIVTHAQNMSNRRAQNSNSKSGVRGVVWCPITSRWRARIKVLGRSVCLGRFARLADAALAYAKGNRKYFGEFGGVC